MRHAFALALLLLAAPAGAATIVLDFEEEPAGSYEPSYGHSGGLATFTGVEAVRVGDFGAQGDGRAVGADDDDSGSGLTITFGSPVSALSFEFGNDDPSVLDTSDEAVLRAFLGAVQVGEARVFVNANDLMDQVIGLSGVGPFDRAIFFDTDGVDEVIDNLTLTTVPEPGTLGLGALALLAATAGRRRRGPASRRRRVA